MCCKDIYIVDVEYGYTELYLTFDGVWLLNKLYGCGDGMFHKVLTIVSQKEARKLIKNTKILCVE
jgi:hypothetical protein